MYQQIIDRFLQEEALPAAYRQDISDWFLPLVPQLLSQRDHCRPRPLLVGIHGAQGTGKSTLAALLVRLFAAHSVHAVALSLDDFYLGRQARAVLAESIHPLLATRGVPGTHDVQALLRTLQALAAAGTDDRVPLPAFDKATDDECPREQWRQSQGPVDIILLEGWFVGAQPQAEADLQEPVNTLEQQEDPDLTWRRYVNTQLGQHYQQVFAAIDVLVMLQAPGFEQVLEWRNLQEQKLRQRAATSVEIKSGMNATELARFIQHFERLTRHCLQTLPQRADIVFTLDAAHRIESATVSAVQ